jgi:hypothetical protein
LRTVCFSKHAHHIFYLQCLTTYRRADRDSRKLQFTVNKTGGNLPGVPFVGTNGQQVISLGPNEITNGLGMHIFER